MYSVETDDQNTLAYNLTVKDDRLKWRKRGNSDFLVIQYPWGDVPDIEMIEDLLNENDPRLENRYISLGEEYFVRYVSVREYVKNQGCEVNDSGYGYMVISCIKTSEEDVVLFVPENTIMSRIFCEVPLSIKIRTSKEQKKKGLIIKNTITYYKTEFFPGFTEGYYDGDIYYEVAEKQVQIPVTSDMVFSGEPVYFQFKPIIKTDSKRIVIRED